MAQDERRCVRRLFGQWLETCGKRRMPALGDVSAGLARELWERSFVIDVSSGPGAYRVSWFGAALRDQFGVDFAGRSVDSLPSPLVGDALDSCHAAVASAKPIVRNVDDALLFGTPVCYRLILLPVGPSDNRVDALLGTAGYVVRSAATGAPGPSDTAESRRPSQPHGA